MRTGRHSLRVGVGLALLAAGAWAREKAGEATIGFQQYYLTNGSQRVANASGLALGFREFVPRLGIVSVSLAPAASEGRFRTGDTFVELQRFPWLGNYWTFRGGDFRLDGRLLHVPFNNLYYPDISGRGAWAEATHGSSTFGFLYGAETLQAGLRVPLRLQTPQTMAGVYFRQSAGERLVWGARFLSLSNNLDKLRETPYLAFSSAPIKDARTATLSALYTLAGPLKWYGEAGLSQASRGEPGSLTGGGPVSATTGPLLETARFTLRANYVHQTASYLPLLGYYLGDRRGPYGEIKVRPFSRLEIYGSASDYVNNVARDPLQPTFRSRSESAGASLQLPARFSLNGNWSVIQLATRKNDADPWENATSRQMQFTLARAIRRHNLRLGVREYDQRSRGGPQLQRTAEIADTFQHRWFSLGGEVRAQQVLGLQSKMSLFVRTNGQVNFKSFSAYANIETGNDLANRTLFATTALSTTVIGASLRPGQEWDFSMELFRSNLITELNRQNIFVLQGQGVFVPSVLSALNQWSLYFRISKRFRWGAVMPSGTTHLDGYAIGQNSLTGSVEGFVALSDRSGGVAGIPVILDGHLIVLTDASGRFRFDNVGEGARKVGLAMNVLPTDYNPGANIETTVVVRPGRPSRADLNVVAVGYALHGQVLAPQDTAWSVLVIRLLPTDRYTTPDNKGRFSFYNVAEGSYEMALDEETLPQYAVLKTPAKTPVTAGARQNSPPVRFEFEVRVPPKPVRTLVVAAKAVEIPRPAVVVEAPPPPPPPTATPPPPAPAPLPAAKPATFTPLQLNARGRVLIQSGNFAEAIPVLTGAITAKPDFPLAYNARGYAFLRLLRYSEALTDFTEAIRWNPAYTNAYENRAAARKALGDAAGAKADADKANALR